MLILCVFVVVLCVVVWLNWVSNICSFKCWCDLIVWKVSLPWFQSRLAELLVSSHCTDTDDNRTGEIRTELLTDSLTLMFSATSGWYLLVSSWDLVHVCDFQWTGTEWSDSITASVSTCWLNYSCFLSQVRGYRPEQTVSFKCCLFINPHHAPDLQAAGLIRLTADQDCV